MDFILSNNNILQKYLGNSKEVVVPDGITLIRKHAFREKNLVQRVILPASLEQIEERAFKDCTNLKEIIFSARPKECSGCAFCGCKSLTHSIIRGNILIKVPQNTKNLYVVSHGIEEISEGAFCDCREITEISLPPTLKKISSQAFKNCSSLEKLVIPESVELENFDAFWGCDKLAELEIPISLKVNEIVAPIKIIIPSLEQPLYNATCFLALPDSYKGTFVVPEGITSIADFAFLECKQLEKVILPKSLVEIGAGTFGDCISLKEIAGLEKVLTINDGAFFGCDKLDSVRVNSKTNFIGNPFGGKRSLSNPIINGCLVCPPDDITAMYVVPPTVKRILPRAFEDCQIIQDVVIGESVKAIGEGAFSQCHNLKHVVLHDDIEFENDVFYDCPSLSQEIVSGNKLVRVPMSYVWEYLVGKGIDTIVGGAFAGCNSITNIIVYPETKAIGNNRFDAIISIQIDCSLAVVKLKEKYGAISLSGEMIASPIYDELSEFVNGYSQATFNDAKLWGYPLNQNIHHQISTYGHLLVKNGDANVLLPKEYDWGTDIINGISIVLKDGAIGVIDISGKEIVPPGKYANIKVMNDKWIRVYENLRGVKRKKTEKEVNQNLICGLINYKGEEVLPCCCHEFSEFHEFYSQLKNYVLATQEEYDFHSNTRNKIRYGVYKISMRNEAELLIPIEYGKVTVCSIDEQYCPSIFIAEKSGTSYVYELNGRYLFAFNIKTDRLEMTKVVEKNVYMLKIHSEKTLKFGEYVYHVVSNRKYYISPNSVYFEVDGGGVFKEENGENYLVGITYPRIKDSWSARTFPSVRALDKVKGIKVKKDYILYKFYELNDKYLGVCYNSLHGITNMDGVPMVPIKYNSIAYAGNNCFIVSKLDSQNEVKFGIINILDEVLLPCTYNYLGTFKNHIIYSNNAKDVKVDRVCDYTPKHSSNKYTYGVMDFNFNIISQPMYSEILDANDSFVKVYVNDTIGAIDSHGREIIELGEYDIIELLNDKFIKVGWIESAYFFYDSTQEKNYRELGVINIEGENIIPCRYSAVHAINDNYILASFVDQKKLIETGWDSNIESQAKWGVFNNEGKEIIACKYYREDLLAILRKKMKDLKIEENSIDWNDISYNLKCEGYGGYNGWDDDAINEAFEGDPLLTWNVD